MTEGAFLQMKLQHLQICTGTISDTEYHFAYSAQKTGTFYYDDFHKQAPLHKIF